VDRKVGNTRAGPETGDALSVLGSQVVES
jgi:hypothetical protein